MSRALDRRLATLSEAARARVRAGLQRPRYDRLGAYSRAARFLVERRREAAIRLDAAGGRALERWHFDMAAHDVGRLMHSAGLAPPPAPVVYDAALVQRQAQGDFNAVVLGIPLGRARPHA